MAKVKDIPNLPGSSRLKGPSTSGNSTNGLIKEHGGMAKNSNGATHKVTTAAKGTGLKKKNPYC